MAAPRLHPVYRAVLLAAGLLVLGLLFRQLITLVLAVLVTVILAIPLSAAATKLERRGVPRAIGAPLALIAGLAVLVGLGILVAPAFADQVNTFVAESPHIVANIERQIENVTGAKPADVGNSVQSFLQGYVDNPERLVGPVASVGLTVVSAIGALVLVLLTATFIAVRPEPLVNGALRLFPPESRDHAAQVMARLRVAWIGWVQG